MYHTDDQTWGKNCAYDINSVRAKSTIKKAREVQPQISIHY